MAQPVLPSPSSSSTLPKSTLTLKSVEIGQTQLGLIVPFKGSSALRLKASKESPGLTEGLTNNKQKSCLAGTQNGSDLFNEMKHRFLSFKKHKFLKNLECFQNLAKVQAPKNGPSETNAALEFSVNSLEVENILVIGHSCCGGIRALMSVQDKVNSSCWEECKVKHEGCCFQPKL
ncbi:beta carbonic anhydrase 5, chloroplastic isoform X4 [Camellia sinensis]|uniref:beta carbonic anhydrase 5, chloroplastic isoform X4 n=1 Tax=Camellia sinensis TaxID=4442 RepID=UPI00103625F0|nr:beta carbonic anhydrase 5, chloroplastic isoform X4 [Camellia sinensis]